MFQWLKNLFSKKRKAVLPTSYKSTPSASTGGVVVQDDVPNVIDEFVPFILMEALANDNMVSQPTDDTSTVETPSSVDNSPSQSYNGAPESLGSDASTDAPSSQSYASHDYSSPSDNYSSYDSSSSSSSSDSSSCDSGSGSCD